MDVIESSYGPLVLIENRSGERLRVRQSDLSNHNGSMIPLFECSGKKRTRVDAWGGSGKPSDIRIGDFTVVEHVTPGSTGTPEPWEPTLSKSGHKVSLQFNTLDEAEEFYSWVESQIPVRPAARAGRPRE